MISRFSSREERSNFERNGKGVGSELDPFSGRLYVCIRSVGSIYKMQMEFGGFVGRIFDAIHAGCVRLVSRIGLR